MKDYYQRMQRLPWIVEPALPSNIVLILPQLRPASDFETWIREVVLLKIGDNDEQLLPGDAE